MRGAVNSISGGDKLIINQELQGEEERPAGSQVSGRQINDDSEGRLNISHNIAIKQTKITVISPHRPYITFHYRLPDIT